MNCNRNKTPLQISLRFVHSWLITWNKTEIIIVYKIWFAVSKQFQIQSTQTKSNNMCHHSFHIQRIWWYQMEFPINVGTVHPDIFFKNNQINIYESDSWFENPWLNKVLHMVTKTDPENDNTISLEVEKHKLTRFCEIICSWWLFSAFMPYVDQTFTNLAIHRMCELLCFQYHSSTEWIEKFAKIWFSFPRSGLYRSDKYSNTFWID